MTDLARANQDTRLAGLVGSVALLAVSFFWFYGSYQTIEEDFSGSAAWVIFGMVAAVLVVQIAVVAVSAMFARRFWIPALLAALFIVANAFSLNLVMNAGFMTLHPAAIVAVLLGGVFVAFTVVRMAVESRGLRLGILAVLGAMVVGPVALAALPSGEAPQVASPGSGNPSSVVRNVDFIDKPNVYFIGFESMAPQALLSKYMGYENSPLIEMLHRREFRVFRNMFTEGVPTKNAITSLLALEAGYLQKARAAGHPLMSGQMPSPLIEIFRHNGYETNTLYASAYFGAQKGPHVDSYRVNATFSVCTFMEPMEAALAFFGSCRLHDAVLVKQADKADPNSHIDFLKANIIDIAQRSSPQLLVAHHAPPQHTAKSFTGTEPEIAAFRETYGTLSQLAAENLDQLVSLISERDPDAILVVFGDHGAWLSRVVDFKDDKTFFVQDRFGVAGGIFPADACQESFDAPIDQAFVTTPQVARMVIRCLAGGVDAFDPSYTHNPPMTGESYGDYVYE
jgi:hypothetical protein